MKRLMITIALILLLVTAIVPQTGCKKATEDVTPTYEELQETQKKTMLLLDELDLFCDSAIISQKNQVEVYVTDSRLFNSTLKKAKVQLPSHVTAVVVYDPLYEIPFEVNPDPSVYFPQLRMRSGSFMAALAVGELTLKDGYLCIGESLIIWQPDYFLNDNNGTIEVLDRNGKVVARVGEEVVMGGGGIPREEVNRMIKEPLPEDCQGPFFLQGGGTRLSLNFSSDLFSIEIIPFEEHEFYFLRKKPLLDEMWPFKTVITGKLVASRNTILLRYPYIFVDAPPVQNMTSVNYATLWPADYKARVDNGVFEIIDDSGNVVLSDGEEAEIEGSTITNYNKQLHDELPGGLFGPYLIVNRIIRK
jgi:hypothetical protein